MRSRFALPSALTLALAGALALGAPTASAQDNLVVNGGFEGLSGTCSFEGFSGASGFTATAASTFVHSGRCGASTYQIHSNPATLVQHLTTTAGQTYTVDFFARNTMAGDTRNLFEVFLDGTRIFGQAITNGTFAQFTATGVATGTTTDLQFLVYNDPAGTGLDDVQVTAAGAPVVTTPEPATAGLFGAGVAALFGAVRRRRQHATAA